MKALFFCLLCAIPAAAEPVAVVHPEGSLRGFVKLSRLDGKRLADGELTQTVQGDRGTSRLALKFTDGSVSEETTVFSQQGHFRLIRDELVQKGPTFPHEVSVVIDAASGQVRAKVDGKVHEERVDLPDDLANGIISVLLKNGRPASMSMLVLAPKPRLVKLVPSVARETPFTVGSTSYTATDHRLKVELGGVTGVVAPLVGKQPPDVHVWMVGGDVPGFVKSEQPMFPGGPVWRLELASPVWPGAPVRRAAR